MLSQALASGPFGYFALSFAQGGRLRAEVYLDTGEREMTKGLFDSLFAERPALEQRFGEPLVWERIDGKRASRVALYSEAPDFDDEDAVDAALALFKSKIERFMDTFDSILRARAATSRGPGLRTPEDDLEPDSS